MYAKPNYKQKDYLALISRGVAHRFLSRLFGSWLGHIFGLVQKAPGEQLYNTFLTFLDELALLAADCFFAGKTRCVFACRLVAWAHIWAK